MSVFTQVSKFKQELLNAILELLWKLWTLLGVSPDRLTVFEMLSVVWRCISNPRLAEVSEKTAAGELQREFVQKINDRLQNCGIAPLSKLYPESILSLPEIVQEIN